MKKSIKAQLLWEAKCEKNAKAIDKIFAKWYELNYKGQRWENSLGPKTKTILRNIFGAGFYNAEKYWKREVKLKQSKKEKS